MAKQYTPAEISSIIDQISEKYFPGDEQFKKVLHSLVFSESSYDNNKVGDNGASIGLLQANRKLGRGIGYSVEQLQDPVFNLELAMKEIAQAYKKAVEQGLTDGDVSKYVSRVAQRPAAGNEEIPKQNYGVNVSGTGEVILPTTPEILGAETTEPIITPTATPTPTPQKEKLVKVAPGLTVNVATPEGLAMAKRYGYDENKTESEDPIYSRAKEIQQEYNKFNSQLSKVPKIFQGVSHLLKPAPAFSAEPEINKEIGNVEGLNLGFLEKVRKTQGYGEKTFSFYGKGGHEGNDFSASVGTPVRGFEGWVVDFAGQGESYYGNKVVLRNPNTGEAVEFAHLNDIRVQKGQVIGKNQVIATTGNSGYRPDGKAQQAHLHVNYYTPDNKRGDISKVAKQTENNFSMVPSFDSVINKAKQITQNLVKPKPVMATEETTPIIKPTATDQKLKETPLEDRNIGTRVIKPGETLSALAKQYNVTVNDFMRQNPQITNPNIIRANEVIKVPVKTDVKTDGYTIKPGDTLSAIARNLGTTVNDLVRKNNIQNPNLIRAGERIKA